MFLEELYSSVGKLFLDIHYQAEGPWIYADWVGYPTSGNVLKGARAYLDQMQRQQCVAVLNDNRHLVGGWNASLDWLEREWIPYAVQTGLKYWAHLDNPDAFSQESAAALRERVNGRFQIELFDNLPAAQAWLRACLVGRAQER